MGSDFMVGNLPLPKRLIDLVESGLWPQTADEALRQNLRSLVSKERIQLFAPQEDRIYLLSPPFHTVAKRMSGKGGNFWSKYGALEGIAPDLSVVIADFGIGSDSPILLDYRKDPDSPTVIRLLWRKPASNIWVRCAETFDEFADMLQLERTHRPTN